MLNPQIISENIAFLRQQANMTQQELAARVNVTHQAVSKWENGSSIPDLQTLMTLSRLFSITLDELLTEVLSERRPPEEAQQPQEPAAPEQAPFPLEPAAPEGTDAAPQPQETPFAPNIESLVQKAISQATHAVEQTADSLRGIMEPIRAEDEPEPEEDSAEDAPSLNRLTGMAPFLSRQKLREQVLRLNPETIELRHLAGLAPFLDRDTLDQLLKKLSAHARFSIRDLAALAPFLSRDTLDSLLKSQSERSDFSLRDITTLAPFLSRDTLGALVDRLPAEANLLDALGTLAPFLPPDSLNRFVEQIDPAQVDPESLAVLAPFISPDTLSRFEAVVPSESNSLFGWPTLKSKLKNAWKDALNLRVTRDNNGRVNLHFGNQPEDAESSPSSLDEAIDSHDWDVIEDRLSQLTPAQAERTALAAAVDGNFDLLPRLAPGADALNRIAKIAAENGEWEMLEPLVDHLSEATVSRLIDYALDQEELDFIEEHISRLPAADQAKIAVFLAENED